MAYYPTNYYNPYLYQPQAPSPAQQIQQPTAGIVWISNEREAAMYPVAPNNAVTLWNQNEPVVYLKTADATGRPTLKTYDLVERSETAQNERNVQNDKLPVYATKDELAAVVSAVKGLDGVIATLNKDVEWLKATRRQAKRKYEEEEDDE